MAIFCGKSGEGCTLPSGEPGLSQRFFLKDTNGQELFARRGRWKKGPVLAAFFKVNCPTCQLLRFHSSAHV